MLRTGRLHWLVLLGALSAVQACGGDDEKGPDTGSTTDESRKDDEEGSGKQDGDEPDADVDDDTDEKKEAKDGGAPPKATTDAGGKPVDPPKAQPDAGAQASDGGGKIGPPPTGTGPLDGDPSKPVVSIPNVPCGPGRGGLGQGNLQIGGRDVILTYPCEKHEGAQVTFILNLHGTTEAENSKWYSHRYFAAYQLATSHNLIVVEPRSRVAQWGNTTYAATASEDKPHLLEVIDWVYKNFEKFQINGLWVAGHSWGSFYAKAFVCDEAVKDRVRGVIGQSGGTTIAGGRGLSRGVTDLKPTPNCSDYISQIHTAGDMDSVAGLPDQSAIAAKHGCDAKAPDKDLGNNQMLTEWPNCDQGWVHQNVLMGAHTHTTSINPEVVKHIVEAVKATEKR